MTTIPSQPCTRGIKPGCDGVTARGRFPMLADLIGYLDSITARADLSVLSDLLAKVRVTRSQLEPVCCFGVRSYKRNTIAESPYYELLALCWKSGHCTPIHDHKGSSCAFRVVHGTGTEIRYRMTPSGQVCPASVHEMPEGYVCSAEDDDIHQVANFQPQGHELVTLHIYSTPIERMSTYPGLTSPGPECAG
ncbi:MAG: cysteine dioxygenase family protein [Phycisphaeraceae bacterium]|nr:MAG: cysteine dioxygenase family protein [Phycisphaeraceae bacterium]